MKKRFEHEYLLNEGFTFEDSSYLLECRNFDIVMDEDEDFYIDFEDDLKPIHITNKEELSNFLDVVMHSNHITYTYLEEIGFSRLRDDFYILDIAGGTSIVVDENMHIYDIDNDLQPVLLDIRNKKELTSYINGNKADFETQV